MFGYNGNPSFLEVTAYVLYLLILAGYYAYQQRLPQATTTTSDHEEPAVTVTP
jgi:hypothetical protein